MPAGRDSFASRTYVSEFLFSTGFCLTSFFTRSFKRLVLVKPMSATDRKRRWLVTSNERPLAGNRPFALHVCKGRKAEDPGIPP